MYCIYCVDASIIWLLENIFTDFRHEPGSKLCCSHYQFFFVRISWHESNEILYSSAISRTSQHDTCRSMLTVIWDCHLELTDLKLHIHIFFTCIVNLWNKKNAEPAARRYCDCLPPNSNCLRTCWSDLVYNLLKPSLSICNVNFKYSSSPYLSLNHFRSLIKQFNK